MWRLSKNIYRFTPALEGAPADNIHGVDERIPLAAHINAVRFYFQMIRVLTG
jgi:acetylornithine deacetylase/succinyl-diaminopimelate desuccinylase-like protein